MKKWEKFTKEEIRVMTAESHSVRELATKLGYFPDSGSSAGTVKKMIAELNLDTTHFTGQGWNKENYDYSRFQNGRVVKSASALSALVALRGHQCERCKFKEWNSIPIPLEIHHIDGDSLNNELNNLVLYCPNCHAQTDNYRGRNINTKRDVTPDEVFTEALRNAPNIRQALLALGLSAKGGNYTRARELIHKNNITHLL